MKSRSSERLNRVTVAFSTFRPRYINRVVELLEALKKQTVKDFVVLVIVNRDRRYFETLEEFVEKKFESFFETRVIFNPVDRGIAHARNLALKEAITPYVAYIDDDTIADRHWLKELICTLELDEKIGAACGPVVGMWDPDIRARATWFPTALYWMIGCTPWRIDKVKTVRNGFASNLALKREVALKVGGFNENFGYKPSGVMAGEEPEFGSRLLENGFVTLWNPKAVVRHRITKERLKMRNLLVRAFAQGKTIACLSRVHGWASMEPEMKYMLSLAKSCLKAKSLRGVVTLLSTTIAVAGGYLVYSLLLRHA